MNDDRMQDGSIPPESPLYLWLGSQHARSCLAFSRALWKLKRDCYSVREFDWSRDHNAIGRFPTPFTLPSREVPTWVANDVKAPDSTTHDFYTELILGHMSQDMKCLHHYLPHLFAALELPQLPKTLFRLTYGYGNKDRIIYVFGCEEFGIRTGTLELRGLCDFVIGLLNCAAFDRRELPRGWDVTYGLPESPIRSVVELAAHLMQTRIELLQRFPAPTHQYGKSVYSRESGEFENDPEIYCRQIDNAHRALAFWETPNPPKQSSPAKTIAEAEAQLSGLIAWLLDYESTQERSQDVSTPPVDGGSDAPSPTVDYPKRPPTAQSGGPPAATKTEVNTNDAVDGSNVKYSPWLGAPEMIRLMKRNNVRGVSDSTIGRKKELWRAQSQPGSNGQVFRFELAFLKKNGIHYPSEWNE